MECPGGGATLSPATSVPVHPTYGTELNAIAAWPDAKTRNNAQTAATAIRAFTFPTHLIFVCNPRLQNPLNIIGRKLNTLPAPN